MRYGAVSIALVAALGCGPERTTFVPDSTGTPSSSGTEDQRAQAPTPEPAPEPAVEPEPEPLVEPEPQPEPVVEPEPEPPPTLDRYGRDPRIVAAQTTVDIATLRRHLEAVRGPVRVTEDRVRHAAVAAHIANEMSGLGLAVSQQDVSYRRETAQNIIGVHQGADPSRVILVAGHYDTVSGSPGANDNGSGVAAMLTIARALEGVQTVASIHFVAFALQNEGQLGSQAYLSSLGREARNVEVALVLHSVGYRDTRANSQRFPAAARFFFLGRNLPTVADFIGAAWLDDTPAALIRRFEAAGVYRGDVRIETLPVRHDMLRAAPDAMAGDHGTFWEAQRPAILISDTGPYRNPNHHRRGDTIDTLDLPWARDVARWLTGLTLTLAEVTPPAR